MTDTHSQPAATNGPQSPPGGADHLGRLHKMSRTAGLGSSEYVAVNAFAVAAIVFGLASTLVILNPIFLVVPAVAIVLGITALYQIRHSNGTQTGRALAWLAIVLAVGSTVLLGMGHLTKVWSTRADEREIAEVISAFGRDVQARNYDAAYARMSEGRFTASTGKEAFVERWNLMQNSPNYGPVKSMEWNKRAVFDVEPKTNAPIAVTVSLVQLDNGVDRQQMNFVKLGGKWKIDAIPMIFAQQVNTVERTGMPTKGAQ